VNVSFCTFLSDFRNGLPGPARRRAARPQRRRPHESEAADARATVDGQADDMIISAAEPPFTAADPAAGARRPGPGPDARRPPSRFMCGALNASGPMAAAATAPGPGCRWQARAQAALAA
jgi:hypothetical protein